MAARRHRLSLAALAGALWVAGCATPVGPAAPERERAATGDVIEPGAGALGPAAAALVTQSRNERRAGDYARAAATLERALRIEPAAPAVWLELARVRLAQGDYAQAEQLALKAESLADPESPLLEQSRALRAESRRRREQGS